jgi:hypothetical protein
MAAGRLSFALAEVIDQHGLFCELDTDRGSHYFHTPKGGGGGIEDLVLLAFFGVDPSPGTRTAGTQGTVYAAIGLSKKGWGTGHRMPRLRSPEHSLARRWGLRCIAGRLQDDCRRSEWSFVLKLGLMHSGRRGRWLSSASNAGF